MTNTETIQQSPLTMKYFDEDGEWVLKLIDGNQAEPVYTLHRKVNEPAIEIDGPIDFYRKEDGTMVRYFRAIADFTGKKGKIVGQIYVWSGVATQTYDREYAMDAVNKHGRHVHPNPNYTRVIRVVSSKAL